jgi:hypothetical protein
MSRESESDLLGSSTTGRANQQWLDGLNNEISWDENRAKEDKEPGAEVVNGPECVKPMLQELDPPPLLLPPAPIRLPPFTGTLRACEIARQGLEEVTVTSGDSMTH